MLPETVSFTELEIQPAEFFNRQVRGPAPMGWVRHQFVVDGFWDARQVNVKMLPWLNENLVYRYGLHYHYHEDGYVFVITFEKNTDAVMFRLLGGETAWREEQQ